MGLMKEASVAGITFYVTDRNLEAGTGTNTKYKGSVTLTGHFNREDLWASIVDRLNGLEMHKGGDIQSELITILQGQVDMLETQVAQQGTIDRERAQRAEQAASMATSDRVRAVQHAELLQAQLDMRTRERDTAIENSNQWAQWHASHKAVCPSG